MKYNRLIIVLLIAFFIEAKAQNNTFLKSYQFREGLSYDEIVDVTGAATSPMYPDFIFVAFIQRDVNESNNKHLSIAILDTSGNIIKTLSYFSNIQGSQNGYYFKDNLFIDVNGDIYLSGYNDNNGYWDNDGVILKVDTNANVWFSKMVGSWDGSGQYDDDIGITTAKTLNTNSSMPLFICGSVDQFASSSSDKQIPFIAEIDKTNGGVKKYTEVETNSTVPYAMYLLPSGNISVWGKEQTTGTNYRDVWMLFDSTLNLLSAPVSFAYNGLDFNYTPSSSILTSDFSQVVSGLCYDSIGNLQVYAYSITSTGVVNWSKIYAFNAGLLPSSSAGVRDIVEYNSSLYVLADATLNNSKGSLLLFNIDKNTGILNWVRYGGTNYKGISYDMFPAKLLLKDSNLYITGRYAYAYDYSLFLIKADLNGNWSADCYDNLDYGNVSEYNANIVNTNLAFSGDVTLVETIIAPQVQQFVDSMSAEVVPPRAAASVLSPVCVGSQLVITDNSLNNYSWNYQYKDCNTWYSGSFSDLSPGITHNANTFNCVGQDSLIFYAYDIADNWNNDAFCIDTLDTIITITPSSLNLGFSYSAQSGGIQFSDTTTGTIAWQWDFGDGNTDTVQNPFHSYASAGTYTVCLTAWSQCDSATVCQTVTVTSIDNIYVETLETYPNPVGKQLTIKNPDNKQITFVLYDASLKELQRSSSHLKLIQLKMENYESGMYFLKLQVNEKYVVRKIIKN